jgi:hypothetical protein
LLILYSPAQIKRIGHDKHIACHGSSKISILSCTSGLTGKAWKKKQGIRVIVDNKLAFDKINNKRK